MKKPIWIVLAILLSISCYYFVRTSKASVEVSDFIVEVEKSQFIETPEEDILDFYEENKDRLEIVSEYLLEHESLFGTRPVILNQYNLSETEKITDKAVQKIIDTMLEEEIIKQISSLNDNVRSTIFLINSKSGIYEQSIRYVSDARVILEDKTKYNHVKEYTDLGGGWFYCLSYYNEINDADKFRKIVWDALDEKLKQTVVHDWHEAIVSIEDWENVAYKIDEKKREFVISVKFNTDVDGLLGPIIAYLDVETKEIVGGALRF